MFVLLDFHWLRRRRRVNGVTLGGRRRLLADPHERAALLDRVLRPIVERYGDHPTVWAWDLINEPEWATLGAGTWNPWTAIPRRTTQRFIADAAALVHAHARQPVTVGSASARWLPLVRPCGLDFYQVHWYDQLDRRAPLDRPAAALALDRPVILGECPTRGSRRDAAALVQLAYDRGYAGAFPWSWLSDDPATDRAAARRAVSGWRPDGEMRPPSR
jgi:hypothetical protein